MADINRYRVEERNNGNSFIVQVKERDDRWMSRLTVTSLEDALRVLQTIYDNDNEKKIYHYLPITPPGDE